MSSGIPDIYSFFNEFKKYKEYDNYIEANVGKDEHHKNTCGAFITDVKISSTETTKEICKKFKNLYKFIIFKKSNLTNKSPDNDDFAYLIYWINSKLKDNRLKHNVTVSEFHRNMNNQKCIDIKIPDLPTYNYASLGNKEMTLVGSALGPSAATLFTLLFLYKFTPFRQWVHSKIGKNKEAHSIVYEENDQSLLNTSDNENINFDRNPYNISYDSVGNL
ncbi:PIR Superfamily Protein [Plasmodium ovale wallikeri]|uniref:PIR Superfamily Protein n=1 Tax=Plasmodium ovale wallikeri TaxID=864142 RepID=A0A1A9AIB5_PLAOA|nr:PIR Superfamily Protein [Plasmodium ovale wallikeri]SBT55936.1 PIR Superfamily Protein [Plasmodium ovale wallikeri]